MKKYLLFSLLIFISFKNSRAQITFQKKYSRGNINSKQPVVQTLDGGYAYSNYVPDSGLYINKVSSEGNLNWSKKFLVGGWLWTSSLIQIPNGHFLGGGVYEDTSMFFSHDFFLFETDSSGNIIWAKTYGDTTIMEQAMCMQMTNDNGYILAGGIGGSSLIVKTNSVGDTLWTKTYSDSFQGLGCNFIQQTFDNGFILTGKEGNWCYLLKTDSTGEVLWVRSFINNYFGSYGNFPHEIHQTLDSGFIIGGFRDTIQGGDVEIFLIRTNRYGDTLWTRVFNSPERDLLYSLVESSDEGIAFTGSTYSNQQQISYIVKIDLNGDTLWMKSNSILDWSEGYSLISTSDEGYMLTGACSDQGFASLGAFLMKTDSSGNSECNQNNIVFDISTLQTTISNPGIYSQSASITVKNIAVQTSNFNIVDTTFCSSVAINEIDDRNYITISPNPASSDLFLEGITNENFEVIIYNSFGQKVLTSFRKERINIQGLFSGMYLVVIVQKENIFRRKFVKY